VVQISYKLFSQADINHIYTNFSCTFKTPNYPPIGKLLLMLTQNIYVQDVDNYINHRDVTDLRKKEVLHKNWNERVYKPLRKKIIEAMDSNDWPEVDRRKRELHRQYLEFTNEKVGIFHCLLI
jgi:hypothetical protein